MAHGRANVSTRPCDGVENEARVSPIGDPRHFRDEILLIGDDHMTAPACSSAAFLRARCFPRILDRMRCRVGDFRVQKRSVRNPQMFLQS